MGDVFRYRSKAQLETLDNIEMFRLLYLFEIATYVRNLDETDDLELEKVLKDLPLVTDEHYQFIVENLTLPEDVLGENK